MSASGEYALRTGAAGVERMNLLAGAFAPATRDATLSSSRLAGIGPCLTSASRGGVRFALVKRASGEGRPARVVLGA